MTVNVGLAGNKVSLGRIISLRTASPMLHTHILFIDVLRNISN